MVSPWASAVSSDEDALRIAPAGSSWHRGDATQDPRFSTAVNRHLLYSGNRVCTESRAVLSETCGKMVDP